MTAKVTIGCPLQGSRSREPPGPMPGGPKALEGTQRGTWVAGDSGRGWAEDRGQEECEPASPKGAPGWPSPAHLPLSAPSELQGEFFRICCVPAVFWALTRPPAPGTHRVWGAAHTLGSSRRYQPQLVWARACWGRADWAPTAPKPTWPCLPFCLAGSGAQHGDVVITS